MLHILYSASALHILYLICIPSSMCSALHILCARRSASVMHSACYPLYPYNTFRAGFRGRRRSCRRRYRGRRLFAEEIAAAADFVARPPPPPAAVVAAEVSATAAEVVVRPPPMPPPPRSPPGRRRGRCHRRSCRRAATVAGPSEAPSRPWRPRSLSAVPAASATSGPWVAPRLPPNRSARGPVKLRWSCAVGASGHSREAPGGTPLPQTLGILPQTDGPRCLACRCWAESRRTTSRCRCESVQSFQFIIFSRPVVPGAIWDDPAQSPP